MSNIYRHRRVATVMTLLISLVVVLFNYYSQSGQTVKTATPTPQVAQGSTQTSPAIDGLKTLSIKGRASKIDYSRAQFGDGWLTVEGCDTRNIILNRDLANVEVDSACNVIEGILNDPYTGKIVQFTRGSTTSADVQIDHVVALSDAWQKGAQQLTRQRRIELANDPLELLAVDGPTNQKKMDGDAATWLPSNKAFRCQYVARQIAIKQKYGLWLTQAEYNAISLVLTNCPAQPLQTK